MNWTKIIFLIFFMSLVVPVIAQHTKIISMQWNIAALLPAENGNTQSIGFAGPVTGLHDNMFFIAGGANFPEAMPWMGGNKKFYNKVYAYSTKNHQLVFIDKKFSLPFNVAYSACCNTPDGVLYAGGENENGMSNQVWLMQWNSITENIVFKKLPDLPVPVSNASISVVGDLVFVAGGETSTTTLDQFIVLNLQNVSIGWKQLTKIPKQVSHSVLTTIFNKSQSQIFLSGGRKKNNNGISEFYASTYAYDILSNSWQTKASLPYPLCAGTGMVLNSNHVMLFGGDKGTTFHQVEILLAAISSEKDAGKKQALILQKNKLQSEHPGFSKEVLVYDSQMDSWKIVDTIPYESPVTTTAVKWDNDVLIPSGEIRAGVRSPKILSVKIIQ